MTPAYASSSEELEQIVFLFNAHSEGKEKNFIFSITDSILLIFKIIKRNMSFNYLVLFKRD